jgi:hypothetical protein
LWAYPSEEAGCTLLQYVDDLFLAAANHQDYLKGTDLLLHLLWEAGYNVSFKKGLDLPRLSQIFGISYLSRPAEPQCRKKTSRLFNPDSNYKKTDL